MQHIDKHRRINELRKPLTNKPIAGVTAQSTSKLKLGKPRALRTLTADTIVGKESSTVQCASKTSSTATTDFIQPSEGASKNVDQIPSTPETNYDQPTTSKNAYAISSKSVCDNPSTITRNIFDIPSTSQYTIEDMFNKVKANEKQQQNVSEEIPSVIEEPSEDHAQPVLFTSFWGEENEVFF